MSEIELKSLRAQPGQTELFKIMEAQIKAAKRLVTAARGQVAMHQIGRNEEGNWPAASRRYDAFFSIREVDAVMKITSIGPPSEESRDGLFVCIYSKDQGVVNRIAGLQTVKDPNFVDEEEALRLSHYYSHDQLELLAGIIAEAASIDKAAYERYVRPG